MGKKKIVIDTTNLISALGWEGNSRELFRKVIEGEYSLYVSTKQLVELKRVMTYPKFQFTEEQKRKFIEILFEVSTIVDARSKVDVIKEDPMDNHLIECAVDAGAGYIISGDRHLRKLGQFRGIVIVTVSEFLTIE